MYEWFYTKVYILGLILLIWGGSICVNESYVVTLRDAMQRGRRVPDGACSDWAGCWRDERHGRFRIGIGDVSRHVDTAHAGEVPPVGCVQLINLFY